MKLSPESIATLRDQLFDGLMTQLRSIPIGLRVDSWIMREYPELSELQQKAAMQQLQENLQVLSPEIKKIAPTKILTANLSMNAAFAEFWARPFPIQGFRSPIKPQVLPKLARNSSGLSTKFPMILPRIASSSISGANI